jgi:hypothetical protein
MMDERVACQACGGWVFHLAKACPHCGAPRGPLAPPPPSVPAPGPRPPLRLDPEEARALLQATASTPRPAGLGEVASEVVLPRGGLVDLALSLLAAPVTVLTVAVLGFLLVRERRGRREARLQGLRRLAVPACTALAAAMGAGSGLPGWAWGLLGASFAAWAARELLRRARRPPPLG